MFQPLEFGDCTSGSSASNQADIDCCSVCYLLSTSHIQDNKIRTCSMQEIERSLQTPALKHGTLVNFTSQNRIITVMIMYDKVIEQFVLVTTMPNQFFYNIPINSRPPFLMVTWTPWLSVHSSCPVNPSVEHNSFPRGDVWCRTLTSWTSCHIYICIYTSLSLSEFLISPGVAGHQDGRKNSTRLMERDP